MRVRRTGQPSSRLVAKLFFEGASIDELAIKFDAVIPDPIHHRWIENCIRAHMQRRS